MGGSAPKEEAVVFTSPFPELSGKEYSTEAEKNTAEAAVTKEREAAAAKKKAEEEAKAATEARLAEQERVRQEKAKVLQEGKSDLVKKALTDPTSLATQSEVAKVATSPDQFIAEGTGDAGAAATATTSDNPNSLIKSNTSFITAFYLFYLL